MDVTHIGPGCHVWAWLSWGVAHIPGGALCISFNLSRLCIIYPCFIFFGGNHQMMSTIDGCMGCLLLLQGISYTPL